LDSESSVFVTQQLVCSS